MKILTWGFLATLLLAAVALTLLVSTWTGPAWNIEFWSLPSSPSLSRTPLPSKNQTGVYKPASKPEAASSAAPSISRILSIKDTLPVPTCPDVLRHMTQGRWKSRTLTTEELKIMKNHIYQIRHRHHNMPKSIQRRDGQCANVSQDGRGYFMALCEPEGPTPCCYHNICTNRTIEDCKCNGCLDIRTRLYAEYSQWIPQHPLCNPVDLSVPQLCRLLANSTLIFVGDSLTRQMYAGLLMILTGNNVTGAQRPGIPKEKVKSCSGIGMFMEKVCRFYLHGSAQLCNGSVRVGFRGRTTVKIHGKLIREDVLGLLHKPRTVVFINIGGHGGFNITAVQQNLMEPLLQKMRSEKARWPQIMWGDTHRYGLLKFTHTVLKSQSSERAANFNAAMTTFLAKRNVPVFVSYNMTTNVISPDGTHFGLGVNILKAKVFLNYLLELHSKGLWPDSS